MSARKLIERDEFGQPVGDWSDFEMDLLAILEEITCEDISPEKSLAAYMADIEDLFAARVVSSPPPLHWKDDND